MTELLKRNRYALPVAGVLVVFVAVALIWFFGTQKSAYVVYIDGEEKMYVGASVLIDDIINEIEKDNTEKYGREIKVGNEITFEKAYVKGSLLIPDEEVKKTLQQEIDLKTQASTILVKGKKVACLESKQEANKLLEKLKEESTILDENEKLLEVKFAEKVEVKENLVNAAELMTPKQAYNYITIGSLDPQTYTVEDGDCLWLIARRNDMYVDDILAANHLESERLQIGQELILEKRKPYITVLTEVEGEKIETIPYETKVVVDNNAPVSIRVTQAGKNGERRIAYRATMANGVEQDREILKEEILQEPVNKVLVKGNKVVQVASRGGSTSGNLSWPVYGTLTQYYKGSAHTGVDIAASRGTPLCAADSGYVTFTGWQGGYGNLVTVDHGNGIVTRYAHCDSIWVSVGQKVERGQQIAALGNTGRSTGPHVHFEVKVYGRFQNPLNYLR